MPEPILQAASLKKRIHEGNIVVGVSVPATTAVESLRSIVERGPYDFVSVDSQHAPYNEECLVLFCERAAELGVHVQFRIKHTRHTYMVGNFLDLGPTGIEVPQVETEETVDEAVSNFYYPQRGVRSWGGRSRLGIKSYGVGHRDYAAWWARTGVLWIQVESVNSVTSVRKLAKPGVDCVSFGPMDLTFSLEAHPEHVLKTVDDCVGFVAEALKDTDTAVCYRNNTPETRQKYIDMGVTVLLEQSR